MGSALQTSYSDAPVKAFIGQLDANRHANKSTGRNHEAATRMPFGMPVVYDPAGAESDLDVTIPANSTDRLKGIVYRTDGYMPGFSDAHGDHGQLFSDGLAVGVIMDIARAGRIWVKCMTGCAPGDGVHIAYASGGGTYTAAGEYGNAAAGGSTIDVSGRCMWDSTAAAGEGAWLLFDFTKKS